MRRPVRAEFGAILLAAALFGSTAQAEDPPALQGVDAPELAARGAFAVGVADTEMVQRGQLDPLQGDDAPAPFDRRLTMKVWYPAAHPGSGVTYHTALSGPDARDVPFTVAGLATPGAPAAAGRFPLVILAHGYGNTPEVLAWLGENLASKGYVVVAPAFRDPPISQREKASYVIARRPLDVAFVTGEAQRRAQAGEAPFAHADAERTALIGYSIGGYGVLTAAGGALASDLVAPTRGVLAPFVAGGTKAASLKAEHLKAVVAMSAPIRLGTLSSWAPNGLSAIVTPTLLIVGTQDHLVGYDPGVRSIFEQEINAPRYLLSLKEAGHNIAFSAAPAEMQKRAWDKDWFEDPVWRKDRLMGIESHFITAFLDRYVKGDAGKAAYLDGLIPNSDDGTWPTAPPDRYGGYSSGAPAATLWKGFQPNHAAGMMLEFKPPA